MAIKRILKINGSWTELFNFQNSFNEVYFFFCKQTLSSWDFKQWQSN